MNRSSLDRLISTTGFIIAVVLLLASGGLYYAQNFIHGQVRDQLVTQKISFPANPSPAMEALPTADKAEVSKYAGQQLTTGRQAEVFANHYIAAHLKDIGGGKTYSELSTESRANPDDKALAGQVETVFRGETLRGLLLNAYAFDTMATVAAAASLISFVSGLLLLALAWLGFAHATVAAKKKR